MVEPKTCLVIRPLHPRVKKWTIYYRDFSGSGGDIPRPTGSSIHCCDRNTRSSRPLLLTDRCITLLSQPRHVNSTRTFISNADRVSS